MNRASGGRIPRFVVGATFGVFVLSTPPALAQAPSAKELAEKARDLARAGRLEEACRRFEESLSIEPLESTRVNLAICYERLGKLTAAFELYRKMAGQLETPNLKQYAEQHAAELETTLPIVTLRLEDPPGGLVVELDGRAAQLGERRIDPGTHRLVLTAPRTKKFERTFEISRGDRLLLELPPLASATEPAPLLAIPRNGAEQRDEPSRSPAFGYGAGSLAALGFGAGTYFGLHAFALRRDAEASCASGACDSGKQQNDAARTNAWLATSFFTVGALAAGALVWWLLTPPRTARHGSGSTP